MRPTWLLLFGLAACSPYSFPKEVAAISSGVDQLSDGFTSGYASLAADHVAEVELDLTTSRAKVAAASNCFTSSAKPGDAPCALYRIGDDPPALSTIEQKRQPTLDALAVLKDYAHALAAVTNAADRSAYDAAVAQLSGSVAALAKNADAVAPGASTVAPALVNIVGWLVGTALDQQRFASLKAAATAVGTAEPGKMAPIHIVVATLGDGLVALRQARMAVLRHEANVLVGRLGPMLNDAAYRQGLADTQAMIATLDGLRHADPTATAAGLAKAHDALLAAINDPSRNYPALLKAVGDFADRAAALHTALATTTAPPSGAAAKKGK